MAGNKFTRNGMNRVKIPFAIACKQAHIWEMQMRVAPFSRLLPPDGFARGPAVCCLQGPAELQQEEV